MNPERFCRRLLSYSQGYIWIEEVTTETGNSDTWLEIYLADWPNLRQWLSWPTLSRWHWFTSPCSASGGFTLRSLRFRLRSTEAEPRQDLGRGENLACVYKAGRNEGKWLRISCEVTLTCRPQPRSLQAQQRRAALCHLFFFFLSAEAVYFFTGGGGVVDVCVFFFFLQKKLILPEC